MACWITRKPRSGWYWCMGNYFRVRLRTGAYGDTAGSDSCIDHAAEPTRTNGNEFTTLGKSRIPVGQSTEWSR
jgi:hypothetical protein